MKRKQPFRPKDIRMDVVEKGWDKVSPSKRELILKVEANIRGAYYQGWADAINACEEKLTAKPPSKPKATKNKSRPKLSIKRKAA